MSRVALGSGIILTMFELGLNRLIAFFAADTLTHAVTLTFDPLTLKVCGRYERVSRYVEM